MAKQMQPDLSWTEINTATLPAGLATDYAEYKEAQRLAAQLRETFETKFNEMASLPKGRRFVFGYRFGKLSIAETDDVVKTQRSAPRALSAADLFSSAHRAI